MRDRDYNVHKRPRSGKIDDNKSFEDLLRETRKKDSSANSYRERSLKIHGLICAKCGREFTYKNRHLLTVHHKDGNHRNNPSDGSNWENLCVYCHEDEHSRGLLGDIAVQPMKLIVLLRPPWDLPMMVVLVSRCCV
jgi:5-methylcytosine-specific restriction endonuclease McrA